MLLPPSAVCESDELPPQAANEPTIVAARPSAANLLAILLILFSFAFTL